MAQRFLQILLGGWAAVTLATVVAFLTGRLEFAVPLSGLVVGWATALLVVPGLFLLVQILRAGGGDQVAPETRQAGLESGGALIAGGALLTIAVRSIELGGLFLVPPALVAVLGAVLVARALAARPEGAAAPAAPPVVRHRPATIAGVAALIAFTILAPKVGGAGPDRDALTEENIRLDLRTLVTRQDEFFMNHNRYATLEELGDAFRPSIPGVVITVTADAGRFIASATHPRLGRTCVIWTGSPPPPADTVHGAEDGVPACWGT